MNDRNCLSHWFPRLLAAGLPVPRTEIVHWPGERWELANLCEGLPVPGFGKFCLDLLDAAFRVGPYPVFLRTGQGSGKHNWNRCCHVKSSDAVPAHVAALVEWSHLVDFLGLPHDVWVLREMLPTEPVATLPRYGGMPLVTEYRAFVQGGQVKCLHPYWPVGAIKDGLEQNGIEEAEAERLFLCDLCTPEDEVAARPLAQRVAEVFADDGAWSVDLLKTRTGWYVTDMAEAGRSFHYPGCEVAKELPAAA